MITTKCRVAILAAVATIGYTLAFAPPAVAQQSSAARAFGDWNSARADINGVMACYVFSAPTESVMDPTDASKQRAQTHVFVTNHPELEFQQQVSVIYGYMIKAGTAKLTVGSNTFPMVIDTPDQNGKVDGASIADEDVNAAAVLAMKKGRTATITGVSAEGAESTDTYSLSGVTAGLRAVDDC